jgi:hypothetical protein
MSEFNRVSPEALAAELAYRRDQLLTSGQRRPRRTIRLRRSAR